MNYRRVVSAVAARPTNIEALILGELARLAPRTTLCPGTLARRLGRTAAELRPVLVELQVNGRVAVFQRGAPADLKTLRGPYRTALLLG